MSHTCPRPEDVLFPALFACQSEQLSFEQGTMVRTVLGVCSNKQLPCGLAWEPGADEKDACFERCCLRIQNFAPQAQFPANFLEPCCVGERCTIHRDRSCSALSRMGSVSECLHKGNSFGHGDCKPSSFLHRREYIHCQFLQQF